MRMFAASILLCIVEAGAIAALYYVRMFHSSPVTEPDSVVFGLPIGLVFVVSMLAFRSFRTDKWANPSSIVVDFSTTIAVCAVGLFIALFICLNVWGS